MWIGEKAKASTGVRTPNRPTRSESLYDCTIPSPNGTISQRRNAKHLIRSGRRLIECCNGSCVKEMSKIPGKLLGSPICGRDSKHTTLKYKCTALLRSHGARYIHPIQWVGSFGDRSVTTHFHLRQPSSHLRAGLVFTLTPLILNEPDLFKGRFTHSIPCPCRAHAFPLPCRAAKGLDCLSHLN